MDNITQIAPLVERLLDYGVATLCTVALLIGLGWHFWKLKPTLDAQNQLIMNNTIVTQSLSDSSRSTAAILEKVSDKLISHDERALSLQHYLTVCSDGLDTIKANLATNDARVHDRLDGLSDKSDVVLIHKKMDELKNDTKDISNQINKIAGKIGV